ncbi:DUF3857 domain-containing protein [Mucilaginibacter pallidiroseus]|uniref:DUF3857 domain-containing protein n=1 Tax=Mucilaginibacter pallidiroseus TaxID=2599295 RepID=A0A563UE78_9SPHI|nr:DUF3857 domain-containing protein [Mucilaginibacter pallidiroseus]TWR29672.1 DUF3857 domain-containing protein [Mucilaginibacter pallidiroseus]
MLKKLFCCKPIYFAALFCISFLTTNAQSTKIGKELYQASAIPDSLKTEANSVVRYSSDVLVVKGAGRATKKHHSIITVLNEKGDDDAMQVLFYDRKFNSVGSFLMTVYNAAGLPLKKYHKSDMYDRAAVDGISIVTDDRLLAIKHTIASYPCTIELEYEKSLNSYLSLGSWVIQQPEKAVEFAEYIVQVSPETGFRFQNKNTKVAPIKTSDGILDTYIWKVANLKAAKPEDDALDWQITPRVIFAANQFQFDGIPGDFSTWQNYGKWHLALNQYASDLNPARVQEIQQMTADLKTDKEKARFLYEYMQHNIRYVSVQLGIGGLKPFAASFVDQKKYGDCKAMSNYMSALLQAVNIPSHYAIVNAGTNAEPADERFPNSAFNHVILCVPLKGDTTWLECTSSTQPFGKLGSFTENRRALLVTANGGLLVNTPKSTADDNQLNSDVQIKLNADGSAKVKMKLIGTGGYRETYVDLASAKLDEQKESLLRLYRIKQPILFNLTAAEDKNGLKEIDLDLEYDKFYEIAAGNKQFYRPRAFDLWSITCPPLDKRKTDYYFNYPMQKLCTTLIDLPEGFEVESLPANQTLKFTYGNYEVQYVYDTAKNQVKSVAKFNLNSQVIPAAKYTEMQQYMDNIAAAQNKKLVIRKKA